MKLFRNPSAVILPGLLVAVFLAGGAGSSYAGTLQSMYDAAGPGDGYDKLVILERGEVYTGPLTISGRVRCCIRGNDAICALSDAEIQIKDGSILDIFDTILYGGNYALHYLENCSGLISGNTIYGGVTGIRANFARVTIENNIIAFNSGMGIAADEFVLPVMQYNDVYMNEGGNYMVYCET